MPSDHGDSVPERLGGGPLGDLRPDEIAARQFAPRLWGVSRKQVGRLAYELAAELDRARRAWTTELLECRRLEKALQAARQGVQESQARLAAARAEAIVREARRAAADTLRSARTVAEIRLRAVDRSAPWGPVGAHDDP